MAKRLETSSRKLSNSIQQDWPLLTEEVDSKVLKNLDNIFGKYKSCLRSIKKIRKPLQEQSTPVDSLTEKELEQRKKFKSQFVIGVNEVIKGLERNELCLVLVSRTAQPTMFIQTILSLVVSVSCPAVCVSNLQTTVQQSWPGLTSLTAMGVKKRETLDEFRDLVDYVKSEVVPTLIVPELQLKSAPEPIDNEVQDTITKNNKLSASVSQSSSQSASVSTKDTIDKLQEIDPTKYYIYKSDTNTQKSFQGQDFIKFDKDDITVINVVNGKISPNVTLIHDKNIFGIAPPYFQLTSKVSIVTKSGEVKGRKRKQDSSSYKGITVKQANRDGKPQKKKKKTIQGPSRYQKSKAKAK